jgi:hypothetical protein
MTTPENARKYSEANDLLQRAWTIICQTLPLDGAPDEAADAHSAMKLIDVAQAKLLDAQFGRGGAK